MQSVTPDITEYLAVRKSRIFIKASGITVRQPSQRQGGRLRQLEAAGFPAVIGPSLGMYVDSDSPARGRAPSGVPVCRHFPSVELLFDKGITALRQP